MDNKGKLLRRLIALVVVLLVLGGIAVAGLYSLQIINGEQYRSQSERRMTSTNTITAARGEILDRYGTPLITNRTVYSLVINKTYWDAEVQNETLLKLWKLVTAEGGVIETTLPISDTTPFTYTAAPGETERDAFDEFVSKKESKMPTLAEHDLPDAGDVLEALRLYYGVGDSYTQEETRIIVGLRYEMDRRSFSRWNPFILCEDVGMDLIAQIKERHSEFAGVNVETTSVREYQTTYAAHLLGEVGIIYAEEWEDYKAAGYSMNAIVGKSGMERALEEYLRGKDGARTIETDVSGAITSDRDDSAPVPGNNCILTIDLGLQQVAENSLEEHLTALPGTEGGAAVVIDVNSGEVLAMASYPTYDLSTWHADYNELLEDPLLPLYNRAIAGVYAPGSTYKPLTAVAALEEGVIDSTFKQNCQKYYTRFSSRSFRCMGYHGKLDVVHALQKSCNVFFYETGWLLAEGNEGAKLEEWAKKFGFGQKTGIELGGELSGSVSGPVNREKMLENSPWLNNWQVGDYVTSAIGQCDNAFTPIQMCNYLATVVNGGTRYETTLLKSVKSFDYSETVYESVPTVADTVQMSDTTLGLVMEGMGAVVSEGGTAARIFADYPIKIGGKSGTAQTGKEGKNDNGVFIAFAPYNDPEIAVCVVGEGAGSGSNVAPIVRDILDGYFGTDGESAKVSLENVLQP
ncbi:MAG: penicillin-binding protein [Butyricicoccus sp.]|nr:penicillin-binding protein [Butyricicoccus sp.]MBQ8585137.1 penicillin-binding protein [Butyricicoccus sp.]